MPPTPTDPIKPVHCLVAQPPDYPPKHTAKKIFVFLDGTGNEFIAGPDPEKSNSNVVKLYTTLKVADDQVAYYHPGVGTMGDPGIRRAIPRFWSKVKGLAFGAGFKDNVLDAYRYLMNVYNDGDQIYIFGFSRGSYTARALASLLHGYGLLCRGNEGHLLFAWRMLIDEIEKNRTQLKKDPHKRTPGKDPHTIERNNSFSQTFSRIVTVRFMGIWDTVSSVGWIYKPIRLLDAAQNPIIQVGRHAISIDERRAFYRDNIWGDPVPINHPDWPATLRNQGIEQDIAQVWFPGAHSDVGGSYPQLESAPANEALRWMIGELERHGALLCQDRIDMVLGTPTGVLAADDSYLLPTPPQNKLHKSLEKVWWILQGFPQQYYDKDDAIAQWRVPFDRPRAIPNKAIIHHSAEQRLRYTAPGQEPYKPINLELKHLHPVQGPTPKTTANLSGCFILKTPGGSSSFPDDPTWLRYLKLGVGWLYFAIFWVLLASVLAVILVFLVGLCRIVAWYLFYLLDKCHWIHSFFEWIHCWLIG